jgi:glyoxylase-like metal-dependent hydrolase (beta-lactamase superfamily II)
MADRTGSGIERITDRVFRVPLPLPLRDLHEVNAYAILGDDGVTLVDPGWSSAENEAALTHGLRQLDRSLDDVARIVVTHSHWDHYTQALTLRAKYGHTVLLGREEHHSVDGFTMDNGLYPRQASLLLRAGAPELSTAVDELEPEPWEVDMPYGQPDVWLDGGESIDLGGLVLTTHATPGHTRGHIIYELDDLMFTGDQILPRITPSLGFERAPEDQPLRSFLSSLNLLLDHPDRTMLPAHGNVSSSVHERIRELLFHHEHRLKEIFELALSGHDTAFAIASHMRWTRHERTLDELGTMHGMTAVLEVATHLDLLSWRGDLTRDDSGVAARFGAAS